MLKLIRAIKFMAKLNKLKQKEGFEVNTDGIAHAHARTHARAHTQTHMYAHTYVRTRDSTRRGARIPRACTRDIGPSLRSLQYR